MQSIDAIPHIESNSLPPLWSHQKKALEIATNRFALFFDPGTGKTRTAIELLKRNTIWRNGVPSIRKIIILAPLNVCWNWLGELGKFLCHEHETILVAGQTKAKKIKLLKEFKSYSGTKPMFLVCNLECLRSREYQDLLNSSGGQYLIVDESHNFKAPRTLQTKGLIALDYCLPSNHTYLLTGTPAPQGELDLWSTFKLLKIIDEPFFPWRKKHFEDQNESRRGTNNYWPKYVITKSSRELFRTWLAKCSLTANKNEVLDLPPFIRTEVYAELTAEQRRNYETMVEYLFAIDKEGNELNAGNMLTRTLRLQQIVGGYLGDSPIANNRIAALEAAIEYAAGSQFVVWTIFRATYKAISDALTKLGISHAMLTGDESAEDRATNIEKFQAGELKALIGHPKAGGVGVNLTAAKFSIHYTRSYSLTDDLQTEARNYRGGSEVHDRITRIDIVSPDTIDVEILEALREKKSVQDFILGLKEKHGK
jgi:SNF2 family DNA or RNA helicase